MDDQSAYLFAEDATREKLRLSAVEQAFDALTRCLLLRAGVRPGWRCWEVGAGNGGVARWLTRTVGAQGHVLATDLDDERFDAGDTQAVFARHDVVADPLPEERFDLVHVRFLLEHLDEPRAVIDKLRESLGPGGVIVLEDSAGLQIELTPDVPLFAQLTPAWEAAGRSVGWDPAYGRSLLPDLRDSGLTDLWGQEYRQIAQGGSGWAHLGAGLERLRGEIVRQGTAPEDVDRAIDCLADPLRLVTGPPVVAAFGRR